MSVNELGILIAVVFVAYMIGGVSYFFYHAFKIARVTVGVKNRVYFFFLMLQNPFWRTLEQKTLRSQTSELNAYILRVERQKYFFIAGGIFIAASAFILMRSLAGMGIPRVVADLSALMSLALTIYVAACGGYFIYQAYKISKDEEGADERLRLYFTMLWNPFWRVLERNALTSQDAQYRNYVTRLEITKYALLFTVIIASGLLVYQLRGS
jgi:hypothetical protein